MRMETSLARSQAAYFATNFIILAEKPWFARVTTEVVASTSDQIPKCSIPIVLIKKRYRKKRVAALPITCPKVDAAFKNICLCFNVSRSRYLDSLGCFLTGSHLPDGCRRKPFAVPNSDAAFTRQNDVGMEKGNPIL